MVKDRFRERPGFGSGADREPTETASRARNRTVMLTPEMTGQVRALVNVNADPSPSSEMVPPTNADKATGAAKDFLPPQSWSEEPDYEEAAEEEVADSFQEAPFEEEKEEEAAAPVAEATDGFEGSGFSFGRGFAAEGEQTVLQTRTRQAETLHDMDTPHQKPMFSVNPGASSTHVPQTQVAQQSAPYQAPVAPQQSASQGSTASINAVQPMVRRRKGKIIAFLISYDNDKGGEIFEISTGRWLVTSKPTEHSDYILLEDESVSPLHAFIRATENGKVQVLDQLSEFGTFVTAPGATEEDEITGAMVALEHGSMVRFGNRRFIMCLVPPMPNLD